jgi:hypothetical protein
MDHDVRIIPKAHPKYEREIGQQLRASFPQTASSWVHDWVPPPLVRIGSPSALTGSTDMRQSRASPCLPISQPSLMFQICGQ